MEYGLRQKNRYENAVTQAQRLAPEMGFVAVVQVAEVSEPDVSWREDALCAQTDPDAFYPEVGKSGSIEEVKKVCQRCDVRAQCLAYALENKEVYGIWGGLSERERRRLRKQAK
jgi:WhiB family redox-sensing transcriptional regulator